MWVGGILFLARLSLTFFPLQISFLSHPGWLLLLMGFLVGHLAPGGYALSTTVKRRVPGFSLLALFTAWELSGAVVPESFLKPRLLGLTPHKFPIGLGCGPRICIFDRFPSDAAAAGWPGDPIVKTTGLEAQYPKRVTEKSWGAQASLLRKA